MLMSKTTEKIFVKLFKFYNNSQQTLSKNTIQPPKINHCLSVKQSVLNRYFTHRCILYIDILNWTLTADYCTIIESVYLNHWNIVLKDLKIERSFAIHYKSFSISHFSTLISLSLSDPCLGQTQLSPQPTNWGLGFSIGIWKPVL